MHPMDNCSSTLLTSARAHVFDYSLNAPSMLGKAVKEDSRTSTSLSAIGMITIKFTANSSN